MTFELRSLEERRVPGRRHLRRRFFVNFESFNKIHSSNCSGRRHLNFYRECRELRHGEGFESHSAVDPGDPLSNK